MRTYLLLLFFLSSLFSSAQKSSLSLEDAVIGQSSKFRPESLNRFSWVKNNAAYSYYKGDTIKIVRLDTNLIQSVSVDHLKKANEELADLKRLPSITWTNSNTFIFRKDSIYYEYNLDDNRAYHLFVIQNSGSNVDFCEKNYMAAYTKGNNLFIATIEGDIPVSDVKIDNIVYGQAVHRYEFGISKGTFWSPTGRKLAYYRKDERAVTDYPLVDLSATPAKSNIIKYPMAGDSSHTVTLGIYDLANNKNIFIRTGLPKDQYLTNIQWGPDEKLIYIALLNRDQNNVQLNAYSADSGTFVSTVYQESSDTYVQPLHAMQFLPNEASKFLWRSEKDGFDNIYLHDIEKDTIQQLTYGPEVVVDGLGFNDKGDYYYFSKTTNNGLGRSIYRIQLDSFKIDSLSPLDGVYRASLSASSNSMLLQYSDTATPGIQYILNLGTLESDTLIEATNKLDSFLVGNTRLLHLVSSDSMILNARMITPSAIDSGKKYPVLVYVYNGPGVQLITNSWRAQAPLWMNHLAEKGFIVFTIDGRGSENRGSAFEQVTFRNLGDKEIEDQLLGLNFLKSLSYVDTNKLAVHGWSYGGFMTTSLMLKTPGQFKVGVAGGPVMDWRMYEIMYTERYMDSPQQNPEGYKNASLLNKVDKLEGDLLIIHGSIDDVVVPQHSMDFLKACVSKGVEVDFFTYPMHPHNVRGRDRIHLMNKVISYIEDKLELERN